MRKNRLRFFFVCIGGILPLLFSCSHDEAISKEIKKNDLLPDAQAFVTSMNISPIPMTRGDGVVVNNVVFRDSISGQTYDYYLLAYSDNKFGLDINKDGLVEVKMCVDGNIIMSEMDGCSDILQIKCEEENGAFIYIFDTLSRKTRVTYRHISWYECVKRLALAPDVSLGVGLLSTIKRYAFPAVAGAAAVICLDNRNRWDVS